MVRHKNRYFAVELKVQDKPLHIPLQLKRSGIFSAVLGKVQEIHGDFGLAAVRQGFTTKYCNPYTKIVLIRVQHGAHRLVASVLPLIKSINNIPVQMTVLHVGATMMKCFKVIKVRTCFA